MERWSHTRDIVAALAVIMACCVAFAGRGTDAQAAAPPPLDCTTEIGLLIPCLDFVSGTAPKPSSDCCSGLTQVVNTSPLCLCQLLGGDAGAGSGINLTLALQLPTLCNIPNTDPNRCNSGPAPAPAPVPSPVKAPAPAPSVTPASPPTVAPSTPPTVPPVSPPTSPPSVPPPVSPPSSSPPSPTVTSPPPSPTPSPPPAAPALAPASDKGPTPAPVASPPINATQTPEAGGPSGGMAPPPGAASTFAPSIWIYMGLAAVSAFLHML